MRIDTSLISLAVYLCLGVSVHTGSALAQDDDTDAPPAGGATCFDISHAKDINVINDQYVYIRTYGGNQFLARMDGQCEGLHREYIRGRAVIQPIGHDVCSSDGSHFVHYWSGRLTMCPVGLIEPVEDRAEAREIAAGTRARVKIEPVTLPDE